MDQLTNRQEQILLEILLFMKFNSKAPTYSQMCSRMGIRSKKTIAYFLLQLEEKGFIKILSGEHRGITLTGKAVGYLENRGVVSRLYSKIDGKTYLVSVLGEESFSETNEHVLKNNLWGFMPIDKQDSKGTVVQSVQFTPATQNTNLRLISEELDFSASKHAEQKRQNQGNENLPIEIYSRKASSTNILSNNFLVLSFTAKLDGLIEWLKKGFF